MSEHEWSDDAEFRRRLQHSFPTVPLDDGDWTAVGRRVRRYRAGRIGARIGVPALAAALTFGGLWAARGHNDAPPRIDDRPPATNLPPTTAPPVTVASTPGVPTTITATTTTAATTTITSGPSVSQPPVPVAPSESQPATWPRIGTFDGAGRTLDLTALALPGRICVGVRDGSTPIADACGDPDQWATTEVDGQLYVLGTRRHAGDVVVHTTAGDQLVPAFAFGDVNVFGARVRDDADLVGIDSGPQLPDCAYRSVITALAKTGWLDGAPFPVHVEACAGGVAGVRVGGSSALPQTAFAILRRDGTDFVALDLGGAICQDPGTVLTPEQRARLDEELAACDRIGWPR